MSTCPVCRQRPNAPNDHRCTVCIAATNRGGKKGGAARKREQREADLKRIREHGGLVA